MLAVRNHKTIASRLADETGIAIGPILFVIAVLGILAAAISAGSGSFTAGSSAESNRTKAAAMIDIGQNLKIGFDRITGSVGVDFNNVIIDPNSTTTANDLFSPLGGGITSPSVTMGNNPGSDAWWYPSMNVPKLGAGYSRVAVMAVSGGVCSEINSKVFGNNSVPTLSITEAAIKVNSSIDVSSAWPSGYTGKPNGCMKTSDGAYYFLQVVGIQ